ncbi:hypothetical protein [Trueperella pyogenes]|uniref:hypothetical protein n=1 Tax=Trueperella pyogenes TaxID=1661 RepID=UPI0032566390
MTNRDLWIPLSIRRRVADAIATAQPADYGQTTIDWARAEAACGALTPFILSLVDAPESAITKPTNNSDSLENSRD